VQTQNQGQGRGGPQSPRGRGNGAAPGSPMNPGASQFIPGVAGAKRPHDGTGTGGSEEKRVKGDGEQ
jgi:hypothetical protein